MTKRQVALAIGVGSLLLAACGSAAPSPTTTAPTTSVPTTSVPTTLAPTTTMATTTTVAATENLEVTPAVRQSLLAAGAATDQLPVTDFVGLRAGTTYYAFDPVTDLYYAAAALEASSTSTSAQVATQDDGAYNLFTRTSPTAAWKVYNNGLGAAQDSVCPITLPAAVLGVWNWKANSCYPPA